MIIITLTISAFIIGYLIAYNNHYKHLKFRANDRSWLQNNLNRLELESRRQQDVIKEKAKAEFDEYLTKRGVKFHESLEKQPLLNIALAQDYKAQSDIIKLNTDILSNYVKKDEHRNSN